MPINPLDTSSSLAHILMASILRLLEQCRIAPAPSSSPRPPLPMTMFDMPWVFQPYVERLFFFPFPYPTAHFLASALPDLKSSLSITLSLFYPLSGTLRRSPDGRFSFASGPSDSISLSISEHPSAADFHQICSHSSRPIENLLHLLPDSPDPSDSTPLLAIRFTIFPSHGLCLAILIHHTICDGFSSTYFVKSWAAAFQSASDPPPPPFLDRSVIADPRQICQRLSDLMKEFPLPPPIGNNFGVSIATFTLHPGRIKAIKDRAVAKAWEKGKPSFYCSSFVVACACAWVCYTKARGFDPDRTACLCFPVDWRQRIKPPIPAHFFGNCLGSGCFLEAGVRDLAGNDGVLIACDIIGRSIDEIGDDVNDSMEEIVPKFLEVRLKDPLMLAGSPKLRVYDTDFGWGKPLKVEVTSIRAALTMSMAESKDEQGGIEIGIVLPPEQLNEFGRIFKGF